MTLFQRDQENREEGRDLGREEGLELGRYEGLRVFIELCMEIGFAEENIIDRVAEKFCVSQETAREYVNLNVKNTI